MSNVIKKMRNHMPECFLGLHILLAANMAVFPLHRGATVQAILFFSLRGMRQPKIFLKNKYKKNTSPLLFTLLNQFW